MYAKSKIFNKKFNLSLVLEFYKDLNVKVICK